MKKQHTLLTRPRITGENATCYSIGAAKLLRRPRALLMGGAHGHKRTCCASAGRRRPSPSRGFSLPSRQSVSLANLRSLTPRSQKEEPNPTHLGPGARSCSGRSGEWHVPSAASRSQSAQADVGGSRHRSQGRPSSCAGRGGGERGWCELVSGAEH